MAQLTDGRLFVVEYKGAQLWTDAAEDRAIGEVWAKKTGNLYLMARAQEQGVGGTLAQLVAKLDRAKLS